MDSPLLTFRLFRFRVDVTFTFVLILLLSVVRRDPLSGLGWAIAFPLGILAHELGHAFVARRFGLFVDGITLYGLGGYVQYRPIPSHGRRLAISLAGPFAGFALGAVAYLVQIGLASVPGGAVFGYALAGPMWTVTVFYGVVNLMPAFPLDGGHALHSALTFVTTSRNARQITAGLGMLVGLVGVWLALMSGQIFLGILAAWISWTNLQIVQGAPSPY